MPWPNVPLPSNIPNTDCEPLDPIPSAGKYLILTPIAVACVESPAPAAEVIAVNTLASKSVCASVRVAAVSA